MVEMLLDSFEEETSSKKAQRGGRTHNLEIIPIELAGHYCYLHLIYKAIYTTHRDSYVTSRVRLVRRVEKLYLLILQE